MPQAAFVRSIASWVENGLKRGQLEFTRGVPCLLWGSEEGNRYSSVEKVERRTTNEGIGILQRCRDPARHQSRILPNQLPKLFSRGRTKLRRKPPIQVIHSGDPGPRVGDQRQEQALRKECRIDSGRDLVQEFEHTIIEVSRLLLDPRQERDRERLRNRPKAVSEGKVVRLVQLQHGRPHGCRGVLKEWKESG